YLETAQVTRGSDVIRALKQVGADHILFGTDATYYGRNHYSKYAAMLKELKQVATPEQFQKIIHDNAAKLFRLPGEDNKSTEGTNGNSSQDIGCIVIPVIHGADAKQNHKRCEHEG